jgi:hypothetical protein
MRADAASRPCRASPGSDHDASAARVVCLFHLDTAV